MMKISGIWVSYFVVGTALMFFNFSCAITSTSLSIADEPVTDRGSRMVLAATSRKLKENGYDLNLDDYRPIDPTPSSKASIKPGPIAHGTPLNPFIPKRLPPPSPAPASPKKVG